MALPTIPSTQVVYTMSPHNAPAARCASGGTLCFETLDCFGGQITSPDQRLGGLDWDHINPATGPLYVEGARPGDVLRVEILDIALADHGVMTDAPNEGVIGAVLTEESTRLLPIREGRAVLNEKLCARLWEAWPGDWLRIGESAIVRDDEADFAMLAAALCSRVYCTKEELACSLRTLYTLDPARFVEI